MINAVLDANVLVSGLLGAKRPESTPGELVRRWRAGQFVLVTSAPIIAEVDRALADPFFATRIPLDDRQEALEALRQDAQRSDLTVTVSGIASHPEDDLVLAAAVSAGALFLVTGDRQLQRLAVFRQVSIVSPRDFLALLDSNAAVEP